MTRERGLWPMIPEFGCGIDPEDLPLKCEPCEGTGSFGLFEGACQCAKCGGLGALPLPNSPFALECGHA